MYLSKPIVFILANFIFSEVNCANLITVNDYISERNRIINEENSLFFGENLVLNEIESKLNDIIIQEKNKELQLCYNNSANFLPEQNFFKSKKKIDNSTVFKIIKELPKGSSLHTHLTASVSVDFLLNLTYKENVYGKFINNIFKLKVMIPKDADKDNWISLKKMRLVNATFDDWLITQLSLIVDKPEEIYTTTEIAWTKFKKIFSTTYDLLSYKPIFEEYYYQSLKELYEDNIMYVEYRATPMPLYDLNGTIYKDEDFFELMLKVEEKFKNEHKNFIGAKYIHSFYRGIDLDIFKKELPKIIKLKETFPKLIIGLDFVGFEEEGHNLIDFSNELLNLKNMDLFLHAGETNWFGKTDMNLIDAILLKSKRIGHGFAITKHPILMELILQQNIAIELCPISNQVLKVIDDLRNHPLVVLFTKGYPVVVCNDDPSIWDAKGLSYDFYVTLMAMAPPNSGLKFLKQLAINSIKFSSLGDEGENVLVLWEKQWNEAISKIISTF